MEVKKDHRNALITDNTCVNDVVADYLLDLELPDGGATCTP
ncbi:alpha/beta hydrolase [Picosynechococcus sp. NKBG15041c]|nr:alpha/beta hydrolase [Picosynechococcus sp. NKBG15041c]